MRQVRADLETMHPHTGAGAVITMSLRQVAPFYVFALLCFLVAPYVALSSRDVDPRISEIWPVGGVGCFCADDAAEPRANATALSRTGRRVVFMTVPLKRGLSPPGDPK